jgi:predicted MFS family arabinose efflux permease
MRLFFGLAGVGISVWAITIPFTKIRFGLDDGTLGLILFAGGLGGVLVIPLAGMALARWGSRAVLAAAGLAVGLLLPGLTVAPSPVLFTGLLFLYGAMFGVLDISLNAQGAVVERLSGKLQMSGFHACYSLGTLVVALASSLLLRLGASNAGCAVLASATILLILSQTPRLADKAKDPPADGPRFALPNQATLLLGISCFTCFMTEGVATDWSTIFLRFSRNMPLDTATLGYAAFAVAMTVARLSGDAVAAKLGQPWVMRISSAISALGFVLAISIPSGWAGVLGFGLVGLGTGNIAPLVFSAAARVPQMAAHHAVPAVVGLGYAGFLAGPVVIGLVANHLGLPFALGIDAALFLPVFFLAETVA